MLSIFCRHNWICQLNNCLEVRYDDPSYIPKHASLCTKCHKFKWHRHKTN